jgi:hypothetical protein
MYIAILIVIVSVVYYTKKLQLENYFIMRL